MWLSLERKEYDNFVNILAKIKCFYLLHLTIDPLHIRDNQVQLTDDALHLMDEPVNL